MTGSAAPLIIVVPCYNEADRLDCQRFKAFKPGIHDVVFLFVNDGSTDETGLLLETLRASNPNKFVVLTLAKNCGKAEAVRQGFLRAFDLNPDYVGFWDADLATPLDAISTFLELAEARPELEIIIGSRVKLLGRQIDRRAVRHYLGRVFATVVSLVLGIAVYDTQCGAKVFRLSPSIKELFRQPFLSRWIFDVEIIARLVQARRGTELPRPDQVTYEIPLAQWRDVSGSKLKTRDFLRAMLELVQIYNSYQNRYPYENDPNDSRPSIMLVHDAPRTGGNWSLHRLISYGNHIRSLASTLLFA
jgi:dolichyl-phosphate beta-glucosyltransferase